MSAIVIVLIGLVHIFTFQEFVFPLDEAGKYTFLEVVEVPGMSKQDLYLNGVEFLKKVKVLNSKKKHLEEDEERYVLNNRGSFLVYRFGSLKKAIDGAVEYDITLEFKDGKCRYTITNFLYNEYERSRYGKFEPIRGKYVPLEMEVTSLNRKSWELHRQVVYEKTQELIQNLRGGLIYMKDDKPRRVKKDENW